MLTILGVLGVVAVMAAMGQPDPPPHVFVAEAAQVTADEYAVYRAVLPPECRVEGRTYGEVVGGCEPGQTPRLSDVRGSNDRRWPLDPVELGRFLLNADTGLQGSYDPDRPSDYWCVSRVGWSKSHRHAVVYLAYYGRGMSIESSLARAELRDGKWVKL